MSKFQHGRQCGFDCSNCPDRVDHSLWAEEQWAASGRFSLPPPKPPQESIVRLVPIAERRKLEHEEMKRDALAEVTTVLRDASAAAAADRAVQIAVVMVCEDGSVYTALSSVGHDVYVLIGAMESVKQRALRQVVEADSRAREGG